MSDAEVMTTAIVAALFFSGNMEKSRVFLQEHGYIPKMLAKSRFNRRVRIAELFLVVFELFGEMWKQLNEESVYVMDGFPISACDNYRIPRWPGQMSELQWARWVRTSPSKLRILP